MQKISSIHQFIPDEADFRDFGPKIKVTAIFDQMHLKQLLTFLTMYEHVKNQLNSFIDC